MVLTSSSLELVRTVSRVLKTRKVTIMDEGRMPEMADDLVYAVLIGAGATAVLDVWSAARTWLHWRTLAGLWSRRPLARPSDARPLSPRSHLRLAAGARQTPGRLDRPLSHRGGCTPPCCSPSGASNGHGMPTILPALIVGIGTVAAPFLLMQPGMGLGIAASRTPNPGAARLRESHHARGLRRRSLCRRLGRAPARPHGVILLAAPPWLVPNGGAALLALATRRPVPER